MDQRWQYPQLQEVEWHVHWLLRLACTAVTMYDLIPTGSGAAGMSVMLTHTRILNLKRCPGPSLPSL